MRSKDVLLLVVAGALLCTGCDLLKKKPKKEFDNSGPVPTSTPTPTTTAAKIESFGGVYISSFGTQVTFTQIGSSVFSNVTPAHGRISCIAQDLILNCSWVNGAKNGREVLIKQADGTLKGTFGEGTSAAGGNITFKPKK